MRCGAHAGCDELIVLEEAAGTSYEDYTSVDVVKRVMDITGGQVTRPPADSEVDVTRSLTDCQTTHYYHITHHSLITISHVTH